MAIKCVVCEKVIGRYDDYISCRGGCDGNYHIACVRLAEADFASMKESGLLREWTCTGCGASLTSTHQNIGNKSGENELQTYIYQQINIAVEKITSNILMNFKNEFDKLTIQNKSLMREVKELKEMIKVQNPGFNRLNVPYADVARSSKSNRFDSINRQRYEMHSHMPDVKNAAKETETDLGKRNVIDPLKKVFDTENINTTRKNINIRNSVSNGNNMIQDEINKQIEQDDNATGFVEITRRRRKRSNTNLTHGTAKDIQLKGIIHYAHLHVYGLDPNTTENNINEYLLSNGFEKTKSEKLKSKHPDEYSSYKVSIPFEKLEEAMKPQLWPSGVRVNRFLEQIWRRTHQQT